MVVGRPPSGVKIPSGGPPTLVWVIQAVLGTRFTLTGWAPGGGQLGRHPAHLPDSEFLSWKCNCRLLNSARNYEPGRYRLPNKGREKEQSLDRPLSPFARAICRPPLKRWQWRPGQFRSSSSPTLGGRAALHWLSPRSPSGKGLIVTVLG
jgi:hypothetical protein